MLLIAFVLLFTFTLAFVFNQFFCGTLAETANLDNVNVLINKGPLLTNLGNYTEAIKYFDEALSIERQYYDKALAIDRKH